MSNYTDITCPKCKDRPGYETDGGWGAYAEHALWNVNTKEWDYYCISCYLRYLNHLWRTATCGECGYHLTDLGGPNAGPCRKNHIGVVIACIAPACPDFVLKMEATDDPTSSRD